MRLDHQQCYDALRSRDARFDGRFFVGVRTTGIYCRPICPSRTPLARNVDFYAHPAAAEDAGLRPCRRCRPETAPGSSDWAGGAAIVERALRLIDEGALDRNAPNGGGVDDLARRLLVGGRHLRRLFAEHVGAAPDTVARSRRAHLAKRLLVETDLRVADVAFAAGFGSVRQCNDVVRETFHATPSAIRRDRRSTPAGPLRLRLAVREPFDGGALMDWFSARVVDGLETVDDGVYRRAVRIDGEVGSISLEPHSDHVVLSVDLPPSTGLGSIVGGARRLFDLGADPDAVDAHLAADPFLAPMVARRPGIRVPGCWTGFEASVRAVIGQQISVAAARTVLGRIVATHGDGTFPDPEALVDAPLETLGIIGRRAETIRTLARGVVTGDLVLDGSLDHDRLVESLVAIPGIGPWSASYVALRSGEPDAFPAGDLHLRRVLGVSNDRDADARAEAWRPWRAYGAMHLWQTPMPSRTASRTASRTE
ncbi:AlkA N-terminal domain-containing protein [Actinospongicola halichondriae]|uniref:AlkA N-terminal domain-containing protein n=1 Tax=Actinospongicola halichondriae TaxID=3236844 RepID=UPI003D40242B